MLSLYCPSSMTAGAARFAVLRVDGAPSWYESAAYAKVAAMFCALSEIAARANW